jgi:hypothetical protein
MSGEPIIDTSRVDAYARSRHRVEVYNSAWRPALAGAAGATAIIGAVVVGVWVATPRFTYREIEVPRIVQKDVEVPQVTMKPVDVPTITLKPIEIPVPHVVEAPPKAPEALSSAAPRDDVERRWEKSPGWAGAVVKGRVEGPTGNGFFLRLPDGSQRPFYPVRIDQNGEPDPTVRDDVSAAIGRLAECRQVPNTSYTCVSLGRDGSETIIPVVPVGDSL